MLEWRTQPWWLTCDKCWSRSQIPSNRFVQPSRSPAWGRRCQTVLAARGFSPRAVLSLTVKIFSASCVVHPTLQMEHHQRGMNSLYAERMRGWHQRWMWSTKHKFSYKLSQINLLSKICILVSLKVVYRIWPDFWIFILLKAQCSTHENIIRSICSHLGSMGRKYRLEPTKKKVVPLS